jgi:hypothetical protein
VSHKRLDGVLAGLYFSLARHPEAFPKIPDTSLSMARTAVYPDAPALRIFFTYSDTEVDLSQSILPKRFRRTESAIL